MATRMTSERFWLSRYYLRAHLWLRHRCDCLTTRQRKVIVYGLSLVYLVCSLLMIAQFFLPAKIEQLPIPNGKMIDSSLGRSKMFLELNHQHLISAYNNG